MKALYVLGLTLAGAISTGAKAQATGAAHPAPATIQTAAQTFDMDALAAQGRALLDEARNSGSKGVTLETYVDGNTQLSVRVKDGGGELHKQWADFLYSPAPSRTPCARAS